MALPYDQLNMSQLASFEFLSHRFQSWERAYAEKLRTACQLSSSSTMDVDGHATGGGSGGGGGGKDKHRDRKNDKAGKEGQAGEPSK